MKTISIKKIILIVIIVIASAFEINRLAYCLCYCNGLINDVDLTINFIITFIMCSFNYFILYKIYKNEEKLLYIQEIVLETFVSFVICLAIYKYKYERFEVLLLVIFMYIYIIYKSLAIIRISKTNTIGKSLLFYVLKMTIGIIIILFVLMIILYLKGYLYGIYYLDYIIACVFIFIVLLIISIVHYFVVLLLNKIYKRNKNIRKIMIYAMSIMLAVLAYVPNSGFVDFMKEQYTLYDINKNTIENTNKANERNIENYIERFKIINNIKDAKVGDVIKYGKSFLKTDKSKKVDCHYLVLEKEDDTLMLMSLYLIDKIEKNDLLEYNFINYLNDIFYNEAFSDEEKKMIIEKQYGDNKTHKVFIPSSNEMMDSLYINSAIIEGVANELVLKKYINNNSSLNNNLNLNDGILAYPLLNTKLKKDNIRMYGKKDGYKRKIIDVSSNNIKEEKNLQVFLRPIITIKIN